MNEFEREEPPNFPPLFYQEPVKSDPFLKAVTRAITGCEPGLIVHNVEAQQLRAAMVLAPELPLSDAMAMVFAASLGFGDALGALAPPEVGVHFDWPARFRVNGALCGDAQVAASHDDPTAEPDWLVVGIRVPFYAVEDVGEPGSIPDSTTLFEEGCGDVTPTHLLEAWARHSLVWINSFMADGMAPLHADWRSRAYSIGNNITAEISGEPQSGTFVGLDDKGGLLLRNGDNTSLFPLTTMLKEI